MKNFCFHLNRKLWVTMAVLLTLAFPSLAQKITVTGHVADELGEDLIGATIMEKGTTNGTSADIDGNFTISVPANATLVVSYVGYDPMDVAVNGQTHLNIIMKQNATLLAETVVIGYGSVKKSDATGSVAVVTPDDIEAGISTSAQDLLVGASPGVVVTTSGGDPTGNANIRIRGGSSLSASNNPLIVIDGVPQTNQSNAGGTNALTMLNPQNIESMTILKDASATAIYGSRASNGVIIITTKKGKKGRPQVNFAANFHMNTARNTLDMMNSTQIRDIYAQYGNEAANQQVAALCDENGNPLYNTNWQDEVLRTTFSQDYSLSVGGSAGIVPYRINASFTDNQGIIKTSSMQRTTVGFSLTPKFFNDALSVSANASGSYVRSQQAQGGMGTAVGMSPLYPVYNDYTTTGDTGLTMFNGYYNITQSGGLAETNASQNPVQELRDATAIGKTLSSVGNLQLDYALYWCPELHFNLNLGYQVSKNWSNTITAPNSVQAWRNNYKDGAGTHYNWYELQRNTLLDFYINYKKYFEAAKSDLDVTVGYDWQRFDYHGRDNTVINTLGYTADYSGGTYNLNYDPATESHIGHSYNDAPGSTWAEINQIVSFFGRLNYIFDDTYLLTLTLRGDGTSRFSKDNRWGIFPAVALGWKINNMKFMEPAQGWLNDFKLRLGWGQTGQQELDGEFFPYIPKYLLSYQSGFHYLDPTGTGNWINPLYPQAYNPDLKWETTTTWNVGIDMGFLNNRITLAADWYLRDTSDLLSYVPTGASNTANMMWNNIGKMRNIGVEVTVGAKPVITDNFTWNTSVNVAWNKNKITELQGGTSTVALSTGGTGSYDVAWHIVGQPAYTFLVYEQVYDDNGDPIENQYVDQNGDGVINESDKIMYHSRDPKVTLTWNNSFQWKNWDLGFTLRANIGNYVYNKLGYDNSRIYNVAAAQYQLGNLLADRPLFENSSSATLLPLSSYFVENASFLRCDNISLGYTFRNIAGSDFTLRLFGAVQNAFVITKFTGLDPEEFSGLQSSPYPRPITTTIGLVATF
ncbi:TonB-dependent receptor [uncultured Duncaniella sp.]|uniref:SusC/RagA family TonB-linked outer membrane protein n=1 Tax=uncultured Duncaniella sp. TaxID=2768039 RepID=UPI0026ED343E|nr:TonB-dependent receptor [uncultured Duncaniella sp.]